MWCLHIIKLSPNKTHCIGCTGYVIEISTRKYSTHLTKGIAE